MDPGSLIAQWVQPLLADTVVQGSISALGRYLFRNKDDALSLNNSKISEFIDLIYQCELEIKDTIESNTSASCLDCYLGIDNGKLVTKLYDKRDDFNFPIVNFPFLSSNIPSAPAQGVYVF